jgi:AraC family transcriptional regulator
MKAVSSVDSLNVHAEYSRLAPEDLALWRGLPVGWFDASPSACSRNFLVARPLLALIDYGQAKARFDFGGGVQAFELRAGSMRVYDGRRACRFNEWSCRSVRRIMIGLDGDGFDGPEVLAGLRQDLDFRDDALAGVLRAMVREIDEGCPHGALYAESLSVSVLLRLAKSHAQGGRERGMLTASQLRRVDELIASSHGAGPSLATLAQTTGYSPAQFVRLFRRATGTSPHRYVMLRRLSNVERLIADSNQSLAEIATEAGFSSQSHLATVFRRVHGCTLGEARRRARRERPPNAT